MANKFCFEALDRSLRDIVQLKAKENNDKPFGRLTMVLDGNFR